MEELIKRKYARNKPLYLRERAAYFTVEQDQMIEKLAVKRNSSVSEILRKAVEDYCLKHLEGGT